MAVLYSPTAHPVGLAVQAELSALTVNPALHTEQLSLVPVEEAQLVTVRASQAVAEVLKYPVEQVVHC